MNNDSNNNNPILILPTLLSVLWHATIYRSNANVVTLLRQIMNNVQIHANRYHALLSLIPTLSIHPFLFKIASKVKFKFRVNVLSWEKKKRKEKECQFVELCSTSLVQE